MVDNTVFSIFAWIILNPNPLSFNNVIFTFILGTYVLRIFIAIFDTPFIYLAKYFLPNKMLTWFIFPSNLPHIPGRGMDNEKRYSLSADLYYGR